MSLDRYLNVELMNSSQVSRKQNVTKSNFIHFFSQMFNAKLISCITVNTSRSATNFAALSVKFAGSSKTLKWGSW